MRYREVQYYARHWVLVAVTHPPSSPTPWYHHHGCEYVIPLSQTLTVLVRGSFSVLSLPPTLAAGQLVAWSPVSVRRAGIWQSWACEVILSLIEGPKDTGTLHCWHSHSHHYRQHTGTIVPYWTWFSWHASAAPAGDPCAVLIWFSTRHFLYNCFLHWWSQLLFNTTLILVLDYQLPSSYHTWPRMAIT